jgi:dUTP pyrophosphatase
MNAKILSPINTPEQAKELAKKLSDQAVQENEQKKNILQATIEEIENINPELGGFEEIAALLSMSEEQFAIIAPVFLAELEKSFNNINDKLTMVQAMNLAGIKAEDARKEYLAICEQIDVQMANDLSAQKRDFLKRMLGMSYNAVNEAEGIAKRHILIPIEYCHPDAKMPTYAHLTDAGMDIYLTEDVTIHPGETVLIPTGIKVAIPLGYELQVRPKSGRSLKSKLRIANTPGTIDAGYRDEIGIIADNIDPVIRHADIDENGRLYNVLWGSDITLSKGEKIAQLVLSEVPKAVFYEVESVSTIENDGRNGGFGSTGDK